MTGRFQPGRLVREWWMVAVLLSVAAVLLAAGSTLRRADAIVYDVLLPLDGHPPDPRILLVDIDDASLAEVGPWPWPRDRHAALIAALQRARPKAIAYDILFMEPKPGDEVLAAAIAGPSPLFLPLVVARPGDNGRAYAVQRPVPPIAQAAAGLGHVNIASDADGVIRHAWLWDGGTGDLIPHMILRLATSLGAEPPVSAPEPVLIPFAGQSGHYPAIGAAAVLRGEVPPELLRDRVILVGASARGLGDQHPTAAARYGTISGIELQANLLDGLLNGKVIREGGWAASLVLALPCLWLMLLALRFLGPTRSLASLGLLLLFQLWLSALCLLWLRVWIAPATGVAVLILAYPAWNWRRLAATHAYMGEELERLRREPDMLSTPQPVATGVDPVTRQALLLQDAITRLRDLRAFVTAVLDQLPDAICVTDDRGRILFSNGREPIAGLSLETGRSLDDILGLLRPAPGHQAVRMIASDQPPEPSATILLRDEDHALSFSIAPWRSGAGAPLGWIARFSDITQLRQAESHREELLRFLTHDMRSPQTSIIACLSTAGEGEIEARLAERIGGYARRTLDLADGFVHLARAESQTYRREPVNLPDVVMDAVDDLWALTRAKAVRVVTGGEMDELIVAGDRPLLTRALVNLLDNAVKFSPEGGAIEVDLTTALVDGRPMALCSVTDQGPGIAPDLLPRLFTRFGSGADRVEGIGLGLSFVDAVARGHRGRVWCESVPGKGARFILAIALEEPEAPAPAP